VFINIERKARRRLRGYEQETSCSSLLSVVFYGIMLSTCKLEIKFNINTKMFAKMTAS
jgi:hypothetical protein